MLDRARWQPGGGPSYHDVRRTVLAVGGGAGAFLTLVALRVGYVAAGAVGLPPWPVALLSAGVAAVIASVVTLLALRDA